MEGATGWPQCPYEADDGGGRCILPDFSGAHELAATGITRHMCSDGTYTRGHRGARPAPQRAYPTSKRDAGRWAHQEKDLDLCPRYDASTGMRCRLADVAELHIFTDGHQGAQENTYLRWDTDREDVVRWAASLPPRATLDLIGLPRLPEPDSSLPTPPGWERAPGDYVFAYQRINERSDAAANAIAHDQVAMVGLTIHAGPKLVGYGHQTLAWYRTGPLGTRASER